MRYGRLSFGLAAIAVCSSLSVGCIGKKSDEAPVAEADVPAAAYPDSSAGGYADTAGAPATASGYSNPAPASAPAPAAPSPPPFELRPGEQLVEHRIEPGENLSVIATKYNTSISRIQGANGMSGTTIYAGKTIQVPVAGSASVASASQAPMPPSGEVYGSTGGRYGPVTSSPPSSDAYVSAGSYPGMVSAPAPPSSTPSYSAPAVSSSPGSIAPPPVSAAPSPPTTSAPSYPTVVTPPSPQTPPTPPSFPTPNVGGGDIRFSN